MYNNKFEILPEYTFWGIYFNVIVIVNQDTVTHIKH